MLCPLCKLESPPDAGRCDCGYDFRLRRREHSYLPPAVPNRATRNALISLVFAAFSVAFSILVAWTITPGEDHFGLTLVSAVVSVPLFAISFAVQHRLQPIRHRVLAVVILASLFPLWLVLSRGR